MNMSYEPASISKRGHETNLDILVVAPTKHLILLFITVCFLSIAGVCITHAVEQRNIEKAQLAQYELEISSLKKTISTMKEAHATCVSDAARKESELRGELKTLKTEVNDLQNELTTCSTDKRKTFISSESGTEYKIDVEELVTAYYTAEELRNDNMGYSKDAGAIWDFLVNQMGVTESVASCIIGNCAGEGHFGMAQVGGHIWTSTREAVETLRDKSKNEGFGIAQWTSQHRRNALARMYEAVDEVSDSFIETMLVSECIWLYEELQNYGILDYAESIELQHGTGLIACVYEGYELSSSDWVHKNGKYKLTSKTGTSGGTRYKYAKLIYKTYGSSSNN